MGLTEDSGHFGDDGGPDVSRLVAEHESKSGVKDATFSSKQHEQAKSAHVSISECESLGDGQEGNRQYRPREFNGLLLLYTKNKADLA